MTIVVDANVAVAVLNPADPFHSVALSACVKAREVEILNVTLAEALIHPTRVGKFFAAHRELERLGFRVQELTDDVARRACELRAEYGSRNFPMVDAVVVALGVRRGLTVVTCDAKWPTMTEISIDLLTP
ncbi:MAG: PIN domain-containing protein [Ilumatobacteraceae bacterium]|nr:PIN domain-containing protein [Ilumatobacteraceae bacterium]